MVDKKVQRGVDLGDGDAGAQEGVAHLAAQAVGHEQQQRRADEDDERQPDVDGGKIGKGGDDGDEYCKYNEFRCDNGQCIPYREVCDNIYDCSDYSDERDCGKFFYKCLPKPNQKKTLDGGGFQKIL